MTIARRMLELLSPLVTHTRDDDDVHDDVDRSEAEDENDQHDAHDRAEELAMLLRWVRVDRFDRRAVNRQLAQPAGPRARVVV